MTQHGDEEGDGEYTHIHIVRKIHINGMNNVCAYREKRTFPTGNDCCTVFTKQLIIFFQMSDYFVNKKNKREDNNARKEALIK